jgi:hypothetical protein
MKRRGWLGSKVRVRRDLPVGAERPALRVNQQAIVVSVTARGLVLQTLREPRVWLIGVAETDVELLPG